MQIQWFADVLPNRCSLKFCNIHNFFIEFLWWLHLKIVEEFLRISNLTLERFVLKNLYKIDLYRQRFFWREKHLFRLSIEDMK